MSDVQEILQEIKALPVELYDEVLDFILFLKSRHSAEEQFLGQQVEIALQYRREHPEEERIVTAEEWLSLTEHLDDKPQ